MQHYFKGNLCVYCSDTKSVYYVTCEHFWKVIKILYFVATIVIVIREGKLTIISIFEQNALNSINSDARKNALRMIYKNFKIASILREQSLFQ